MMGIMNNGGIGSIKKQVFLAVGLFFSGSNLGAMCPQTVGAVTPGEAIWQVTSRIGIAANVIQSQICALNFAFTASSSDIDCSFSFGQADVGAGGVYTISTPGTYCMKENVTFTIGAAITVDSSDVTIDMKSHTLDASNSGNSGIVINGGNNNVIIKNGSIENLNQSTGVGGIVDDGSGLVMQNIIIQNMNFNITGGTTSIAGINFGAGAVADIFNNVLVENCQATNCFISLRSGLSAVVRECVLTCALTSGNASITIAGRTGTNSLLTAVIEDCVIKNVLAPAFGVVGAAVFDVENALAVSINNCQSFGSTSQGVNIFNVVDIEVADCLVQRSALDGYQIWAAIPGAALTSEAVITNCVAQSSVAAAGLISGFLFKTTAASGFKSIVATDCVAEDYGVGFLVTNDVIGKIIVPHFRNCSANANGVGFALGLGSDPATALILNGSLTDCISSNNTIYGFFLGLNVRSFQVVGCEAIGNGGDGYFLDCTLCYIESKATGNTGFGFLEPVIGSNFFIGNRSTGNLGGNYGILIPNVVTYPLFVGVSYLNNVAAP